MAHTNFIEDLGGDAIVAQRLNLKRDAVRKWRTQGIPWRWRPHLLIMARELGKAVPEDLLPGVPAQ